MPLYALTCIDKPDSLHVRMGARERHLAFVKACPFVKLAGPLLDEAGGMAGSLLVIEVPDLAAAQAFNAEDPYTQAGLWRSVDIHAFRATFGQL